MFGAWRIHALKGKHFLASVNCELRKELTKASRQSSLIRVASTTGPSFLLVP